MNDGMLAGMLEATRLTRTGQLLEATAAIQRTLRGMPPPRPAANAEAPIEGCFHVVDERGSETGGCVPEFDRPEPGAAHSRREPAMPPAMDLGAALRESWHGLRGPARWSEPIPAEAPGVVPDGGRFITRSYANQAGTRRYKLYIPSGYCGQPLPLVVMLHGCAQTPDDFAAGTRMNELAEEHQCLVAYPAQAPAANVSKCWNWFKATDQHRDQGEPSIIAGITREIIASYDVDALRVYVAGMSAGGAMAVTMAATYPDLYAAVGIHSGLAHAVAHDLPSAMGAMQHGGIPSARPPGAVVSQPVPTIVFHGDLDTTVHPCNGDQVIAQSVSRVGLAPHAEKGTHAPSSVERGQVPNGHAYTRTTYHDVSGQPIMEQWLIHGAGHAWSGGSPRGSYTDPQGPDAAREMMRFFYEHSRGAASASVLD
jgi:poly(hydroxyalkanoate) depolymerase family esterase